MWNVQQKLETNLEPVLPTIAECSPVTKVLFKKFWGYLGEKWCAPFLAWKKR